MSIKSKQYWKQKVQQNISSQNPLIDVELGPVYDTVVNPVGVVLEEMSADVESVRKITDISRYEEWTDAELEAIAANFGLVRRSSTRATCTVTFYTVSKPTVAVVIPRNTVVSTLSGIRYRTLVRVVVAVGNIEDYKNTTTGRYEISGYVEALNAGSESVVAAGAIVRLEGRGVIGIIGVTNKVSTIGGSDGETNEQLVERIRMLVQGGVGGTTSNGLKLRLLQAFDGVIKSVEVDTDTPLVSSTVDVWFLGSILVEEAQVTYWFGRDITLSKEPVVDIVEVSSGGITFVKNIDYILVKDFESAWARTNKAKDKVRFISSSKPAYGAEVIIDYTRNGLLDDVESWESKEYNRVIGLELRYREGKSQNVEISVSVVLQIGFGDETKSMVQENTYNYVNSRGLGDSLELADIMYVIKSIPGVDNAVIQKLCNKGGLGATDLASDKSTYFVVDLGDIIIS